MIHFQNVENILYLILKKIVSKNVSVFSQSEIKNEYEKFKVEKSDDFEMKILVEDWQVKRKQKWYLY